MGEVREFFRICPACGRRFQIRLVSKKLVDEKKDLEEIKQARMSQSALSPIPMIPVVVEESIPVTIDVEDFQFTYKCKHCGHVWSELHVEESKV